MPQTSKHISKDDAGRDDKIRRGLTLGIAIVMLVAAAAANAFGDPAWAKFASHALVRMGIVLVALWLAWPSLKKPAKWLPPGIAFACVIGLMVMAARRELIIVVIPALLTLGGLAAMVRSFRNQQ